GILEIADLHVVNKTDREGADRTIAELRAMLTLMPAAEEAWTPPVLGASAAREEGVEAIADALEAHLASMKTSGELDRRRRRMVAARVLRTAQDLVAARLLRPEALEVPGGETTTLQIAGYGTGSDTNRRFHYLIEQGQTGLSVDFDMPTLMGYDSDDPKALGEVGREGVAVDTLDDVEALFAGIDLERISVSMTI